MLLFTKMKIVLISFEDNTINFHKTKFRGKHSSMDHQCTCARGHTIMDRQRYTSLPLSHTHIEEACTHTYACTCTHTYVLAHTHTHTNMHTHMHMHTQARAHIHRLTQTHTLCVITHTCIRTHMRAHNMCQLPQHREAFDSRPV